MGKEGNFNFKTPLMLKAVTLSYRFKGLLT